MYRIARGLVAGLGLWLIPLLVSAQSIDGITVSVTAGGGVVVIDQPGSAPTLTCPSQCAIQPGTAFPPDGTFVFTINPSPDWRLDRWVVNGSNLPPSSSIQLGPFANSVSGNVQAILEKVLTVSVNGSGQGLVVSSDATINCSVGQTCARSYAPTAGAVTLTATASPGSEFVGWNANGGGNACSAGGAMTCVVDPSRSGFGGLPNRITATFQPLDLDGDGVPDINDSCPNTAPNTSVGSDGCPLDSDGDGVADAIDQCPNTPPNTAVDSEGCPIPLDDDDDGVTDDIDQCPNTPPNTAVDAEGCPIPLDGDDDGVTDDIDQCPNTPPNTAVDAEGCPIPLDGDDDGVTDDIDQCPNTPPNTAVDAEGCPIPLDDDDDGVTDDIDQCPNTPPNTAVDAEGCPIPLDGDDDGVTDDIDQCPNTPANTAVDAEGCPIPLDGDDDGVTDDIDQCPNTPANAAVDAEGCPIPLDDDGDGVTDDIDQCPNTPANTAVDAEGCPIPLDDDGDGVTDDIDQCPNTPANTAVDAEGCPIPLDDDDDGVTDDIDQCPNTPANTAVDAEGCPIPLDDDGDGVTDDIDQCPNTPANTAVDAEGCPIPLDDDDDGVTDDIDQCPNTPANTAVDAEGCPIPLDDDGDGVTDDTDQCPNTPANTAVDAEGCPIPLDDDGDGVTDDIDQCPNTPPGEPVNATGCAESQVDDDSDGVANDQDQCAATQAGESVDALGCSASQRDSDADRVFDSEDDCPGTPAGETVDANGCGDSQKDSDADGVVDAQDICPGTTSAEVADAQGCGDSQKDSDGDGVNDAADACAGTPAGETVDTSGCGNSQLDSDGDGVSDALDQCPNSMPGNAVVASGCTPAEEEIRNFGPELVELSELSFAQRNVAGAIDTLCPELIVADMSGELSETQRELRRSCSSLKNQDTGAEQQTAALRAITPDDIATRVDLALEVGRTQIRLTQNRINRIRHGGGVGVSAEDLTLRLAGTDVSVGVLEQAAKEEMSGGDPTFNDFGNWGFFLQGDIELGERDDELDVAGYDFDFWLMSAGADYRFGGKGYMGASLNFGRSDASTELSSADGDIRGATVYGGINLGEGGFIDAIVAWLEQDYSIARNVAYRDAAGEFDARYLADTSGSHYSAGLNFGYMFDWGGWRLGPSGSVLHIDGKIEGFAEHAVDGESAAWTMAYGNNDYGMTALALGLQADYAWLTSWGVLMPGFRFTFNHDDETTDFRAPLRFVNDPFANSAPIVMNRNARDGEYWESAFSLAGQFSYGVSAYMTYRLIGARSGYRQSGYTLGLRWDRAF